MRTKIFISHRSRDVEYATSFVDFLEDLGVPSNRIVCTSVPDHLIPNGEKIYEWLREQFLEYKLHMLFLLSENYYESPDCLNEMGAAWVTRADSDVILLPGFSPDQMRGCIGKEIMAITCDADEEILKDRLRQLRNKVCYEFGLNIPEGRRWDKIQESLLPKIRKGKLIADEPQKQNQMPEFTVEILALNKQIPGTEETKDSEGNIWEIQHKNVLYAVKQTNNTPVRNLKIFGRSMESVEKINGAYYISVCYMESPDFYWRKSLFVLTRDLYPAGTDGIPHVVSIEYSLNSADYRQDYVLEEDMIYRARPVMEIYPENLEDIIQMKNQIRRIFLRKPGEVPEYELRRNPAAKLREQDAIVMSRACRDPKWNTDGGFGRFELYDLCDEGILFWDPNGTRAEVEYYLRNMLMKASAKRLICLKYEDIITCDPEGNSGYNIPIVYTKYDPGDYPFTHYYLDEKGWGIISNSVITGVKE